jgi:hypothetical protein
MTTQASISGHEIDVLGHWLGVDFDDDEWSIECFLVPLHGLGIEVDRSGYVLFAQEVKAGLR